MSIFCEKNIVLPISNEIQRKLLQTYKGNFFYYKYFNDSELREN